MIEGIYGPSANDTGAGHSLKDFQVALALSGGNALGAYQAGAYEALHDYGLTLDWVVGGSAGAINGAVICGNAPENRLQKLHALWRPASENRYGLTKPPTTWEEARRTLAASMALVTGQPGLFAPRSLYGPWWNPFGNAEPSSLYDTSPMHATLAQLIDFDILNDRGPRFSATATDIESGEDVFFDTRRHRLDPQHLRASSALLPAFPPVEVGDRLLGDAGISANLPLDLILSEVPDKPLLCIAVDLLPLRGMRPRSLGDTVSRMEDLIFATQSRRAIAAWQSVFAEREAKSATPPVTLLHMTYQDQTQEVSGKAFDFSPASAAARWRAGREDMGDALDSLAAKAAPGADRNLTVYAFTRSADGRPALNDVHLQMKPVSG